MTKELIQDYTLKISQASRTELIVILYDLAVTYLDDAAKACKDDDHDKMRENCAAAVRVIRDLIGSLDFTYELAQPLYRLYEYISKEISMSVIKNDATMLDNPKRYLLSLKSSFEKISKDDNSGPVMDNTQTVYAGLTYGKGTLNESVTAANPNRGFSV